MESEANTLLCSRWVKTLSVIPLFISTVVGYNAYFNNLWTDVWKTPFFPEQCMDDFGGRDYSPYPISCPYDAIPMEKAFLAIMLPCLTLSLALIVSDFFKVDTSKFGIVHLLVGILTMISGVLLLLSANKIRDYVSFVQENGPEAIKALFKYQDVEKQLKHWDKIVAAVLGISSVAFSCLGQCLYWVAHPGSCQSESVPYQRVDETTRERSSEVGIGGSPRNVSTN